MNVSVCVFGDSVLSASVENSSILVNKGFVIFALLFLLTLLLFFIYVLSRCVFSKTHPVS